MKITLMVSEALRRKGLADKIRQELDARLKPTLMEISSPKETELPDLKDPKYDDIRENGVDWAKLEARHRERQLAERKKKKNDRRR